MKERSRRQLVEDSRTETRRGGSPVQSGMIRAAPAGGLWGRRELERFVEISQKEPEQNHSLS